MDGKIRLYNGVYIHPLLTSKGIYTFKNDEEIANKRKVCFWCLQLRSELGNFSSSKCVYVHFCAFKVLDNSTEKFVKKRRIKTVVCYVRYLIFAYEICR